MLINVFQGIIAYVSYQQGDWRRLVYGFDDYGNICGIKNDKIPGAPLSGMDMRNKSYVIFWQPQIWLILNLQSKHASRLAQLADSLPLPSPLNGVLRFVLRQVSFSFLEPSKDHPSVQASLSTKIELQNACYTYNVNPFLGP